MSRGFDPGADLQHRRSAAIEILVGGGQKIKCEQVGDLTIMVATSNPKTMSRITLRDVRVVPGVGSNLLSAPRMEKAGWCLSQGGGQFKARDSQDVPSSPSLRSPMASTLTNVRGHRNFLPDMGGREISKASQFLAMGVRDKNCQVNFIASSPGCRQSEAQTTRSDSNSQLHVPSPERREGIFFSYQS